MAQTIKLKRSSTGGAVPSTSSLSLGEVAINTYDGKMYIKKNDGSDAIVEIGAGTSAVWKSYDYTATSSQTSFSGNDNNSESLSYVAGFVQVFLNGILLDPAVDYTATTGSSIVLNSGASTGDLLQIESFTQIIGTGDILVDTFPVSSTQTAFTLSQDPVNKSNISVYVEGVYQESSTYSLSTTTLTLSESPANGTTVEVVIGTRNVTLDNIADLTISGTLHAGALDLGDANIINVNEISLDTIKGDADANTNITFAGSDVTTFTQGGQERLRLNTTGAQVTGNIVVSGTVDGRDVAADGVTADAALSRAGGAMGGAITTNSTFDGRDVSVDGTKLDGIESGATADQTDVEIRAAVESASDSNVFTNADHSKLDAIEALADVTDATNVTAAGALMDSEVTNLTQVKAFDSSDYATAAQGTTANAALPKAGGTMTGVLTINNTNDNQILLTSPSSWTGIGWNDSAAGGTEYIWYNGTNGTFAIGGGGSNVANKKLHVDGGMTIGSGYDSTAVTANSLKVEGTITSGAITSGAITSSGLLNLGGTGSLGSITTNQNIMANFNGGYSTSNSAQNKVIGFIGTTVSADDIFSSTYQSGEFLKNFYLGLSTGNSYFNNAKFVIVQGGTERFNMAQGGNSTFSSNLAIGGTLGVTGAATFGYATFTPSSGENVVITRDSAGPYIGTSSNHSLRIITNNGTAIAIATNKKIAMGSATDGTAPLHLKYASGSYGAESTSGFISHATSGRGTIRIRSDADAAAELFYDVNGAIRFDVSVRQSSESYNMHWYNQAATPSLTAVAGPVMTLTQTGNLGIGVTSPNQPLEVNGNIGFSKGTNASRYLLVEGADATWAGHVNIQAGFGSTAAGGAVKLYGQAHATYPGSVWLGRGASSSGNIMFGNGGTGPTSTAQIQMVINSSGNVGIGTTSPQRKLTVVGAADSAGDNTGIIQLNVGTGANTDAKMTFGIMSSHAGYIHVVKPGSNVYPLILNPSGSANGNVGIGETAPGSALEVNESTNYKGIHIRGNAAPCLTFGQNTSSVAEWKLGISGFDGDAFSIGTGTGANDRFTIKDNGNVGIGTSTVPDMHATGVTVAVPGPLLSGHSTGSSSNGPRNTRDWFVYSGPSTNSGNYVHMKTDLWGGGSPAGNVAHTMSCFTYHGYYAYGGSTTSGGYIGWHNWAGTFYNVQRVNNGTLQLVQPSYMSSDGYVVLVALLGTGYAQFSIDWMQWAGYAFRPSKVTAVTQHSAATGAY